MILIWEGEIHFFFVVEIGMYFAAAAAVLCPSEYVVLEASFIIYWIGLDSFNYLLNLFNLLSFWLIEAEILTKNACLVLAATRADIAMFKNVKQVAVFCALYCSLVFLLFMVVKNCIFEPSIPPEWELSLRGVWNWHWGCSIHQRLENAGPNLVRTANWWKAAYFLQTNSWSIVFMNSRYTSGFQFLPLLE